MTSLIKDIAHFPCPLLGAGQRNRRIWRFLWSIIRLVNNDINTELKKSTWAMVLIYDYVRNIKMNPRYKILTSFPIHCAARI